MNTQFEAPSTTDAVTSIETDPVTYELLSYVFGYMPNVGESVSLERIADDLDETRETILRVLQELHSDRFLDFTTDGDTITIAYKDEVFLQQFSVYQATKH